MLQRWFSRLHRHCHHSQNQKIQTDSNSAEVAPDVTLSHLELLDDDLVITHEADFHYNEDDFGVASDVEVISISYLHE